MSEDETTVSEETTAKPKARAKKTEVNVTVNDKMKQAAIKAGADDGRVTDLMNEYHVRKEVFEELKGTLRTVTDKVKDAEKRLAETVAKLDKLGQNPEPEIERQVSLMDANAAYYKAGRQEREERQKTAELVKETVGKMLPHTKAARRTQRNLR